MSRAVGGRGKACLPPLAGPRPRASGRPEPRVSSRAQRRVTEGNPGPRVWKDEVLAADVGRAPAGGRSPDGGSGGGTAAGPCRSFPSPQGQVPSVRVSAQPSLGEPRGPKAARPGGGLKTRAARCDPGGRCSFEPAVWRLRWWCGGGAVAVAYGGRPWESPLPERLLPNPFLPSPPPGRCLDRPILLVPRLPPAGSRAGEVSRCRPPSAVRSRAERLRRVIGRKPSLLCPSRV